MQAHVSPVSYQVWLANKLDLTFNERNLKYASKH